MNTFILNGIRKTFQQLIDQSNLKSGQPNQEEFMLINLNLWLKDKPDEWVFEVRKLWESELPGYANHPTVIAAIEFLEGMIALRDMMREMSQIKS